MNYKTTLPFLLPLPFLLATACVPAQEFTTQRDIEVSGITGSGQQYRASIRVEFYGQVPNRQWANQWVDSRFSSAENATTYPQLVPMMQKELQSVGGSTEEEVYDAIQADVNRVITQFNEETWVDGEKYFMKAQILEEGFMTRYINLYEVAKSNFEAFLVGKEDYLAVETASVSATDSDGDGMLTATLIDPEATEEYDRVFYSFYLCPGTAQGTCKPNPEQTNNQFTEYDNLPGGVVTTPATPLVVTPE